MGMLGTSCNKVESQEMETPATPKDNIVTLTTTVGFVADSLNPDYTHIRRLGYSVRLVHEAE